MIQANAVVRSGMSMGLQNWAFDGRVVAGDLGRVTGFVIQSMEMAMQR